MSQAVSFQTVVEFVEALSEDEQDLLIDSDSKAANSQAAAGNC